MVAGFYGALSERALRSNEPLARWHPALHELGPGSRMSPFEGKGRNSIKVADFRVDGRFTVGKGGGASPDALLRDWTDASSQNVTDLNNEPFPTGSHIEGVIVRFMAGSKEKDGATAIGPGQIRLVLENADGSSRIVVHPVAVTSQANPATIAASQPQNAQAQPGGTPAVWGRWRFNAADTHIASVGGASEALFGFEFMCPPGYAPIAVYVKGARVRLDEGTLAKPQRECPSAAARDAFLAGGMTGVAAALPASGTGTGAATTPAPGGSGLPPVAGMDASGATQVGNGRPYRAGQSPEVEGVRITHMLPDRLQKGQEGALEIDDKNIVVGGHMITTLEIVRVGTAGVEKSLIIDQLQTSQDTVLVWVEIPATGRTSILGRALGAAEQLLPPTLVDSQGERYQPVGFMYKDESSYQLKFSPGDPITAMSQMPALSRSRPAQKLELIFRVSFGREIRYLSLGSKVIVEYNPPWPANVRQVNR
jgi:hypothetical protein